MRIALLSDATMPSPTPGTHGLGLVAWQVAEGLRSRGHDVTLIAKQGSQFSGTLVMPVNADGYEGEKMLAAAALLSHQQWNYDVFLDMGHLHHLSLVVPHLPVVNVYHDNYQPYARCPILLSYGQQAMLSPKFDKARVIWNSLNPADFQPRYDNITEPYALFIGAMSELKQPLLAIEACARLGLKLLMAGQPVFGKVPITAHSNVEYVGMVTGSAKADLYRNARVLLQLGVGEAFGLTTLEAGLYATPVVGWPYGGTLDLVRNGVNGILVSATAKDKVQAVCDAVQRTWYLRRMTCRAYAEVLCNNEQQIDLYEQSLADCAKGYNW